MALIADRTRALALCWHTTMLRCTLRERSHPSSLDLPQPARPPPRTSSLFFLILSSLPSPLPVPCLIHGARFLSLFCKSCEGNLEGLSGINLKGKRLSLLLSLALSADWVRSPGTLRLLISTALPHRPHLCSKFLSELSSKKKKKQKKFCSTFCEMWPHPLFPAPVRDSLSESFCKPTGWY